MEANFGQPDGMLGCWDAWTQRKKDIDGHKALRKNIMKIRRTLGKAVTNKFGFTPWPLEYRTLNDIKRLSETVYIDETTETECMHLFKDCQIWT